MASIRKRQWINPKGKPQIAYLVTYNDAAGTRRCSQFPTKTQANEYKQRVERELFDGTLVASVAGVRFRDLAERYLRDCERRHKLKDHMSGNTLDLARRLIGVHLIPAFGSLKAHEIASKHIRDFVNEKAVRYSRVTLSKLIKHTRDILQFGIQEGCVKRNVVRDDPPRIPIPVRGQIEIPSLDDLRRIFSTVDDMLTGEGQRLPGASRRQKGDGPIYTGITVFAAITAGMRRGEIAALRWENISFEKGRITVKHSLSRFDGLKEPKSRAGLREVPLHPRLAAHLKPLWERRGRPLEGYVMLATTGRPIGAQELALWHWEPIAKAVNVRRADGSLMGLHSLRHAAASLWIKAGVPDLAIKRAIGHASIATTKDVYGHLFVDDDTGHDAMMESMTTVSAPMRAQLELTAESNT